MVAPPLGALNGNCSAGVGVVAALSFGLNGVGGAGGGGTTEGKPEAGAPGGVAGAGLGPPLPAPWPKARDQAPPTVTKKIKEERARFFIKVIIEPNSKGHMFSRRKRRQSSRSGYPFRLFAEVVPLGEDGEGGESVREGDSELAGFGVAVAGVVLPAGKAEPTTSTDTRQTPPTQKNDAPRSTAVSKKVRFQIVLPTSTMGSSPEKVI